MSEIDHLLFGAPNLALGVRDLADRSGIHASAGGAHPGLGTHNALAGLGSVYLEIIAPDPEQPAGVGLGAELASLVAPRLHGFAVRSHDLERLVGRLQQIGLGAHVIEMSRGRPDRPEGQVLHWRIALATGHGLGRFAPFAIDWGESPNPASELAPAGELVSLEFSHPRARDAQRMLDALELELPVAPGLEPRLVANLDSPHGRVALVS